MLRDIIDILSLINREEQNETIKAIRCSDIEFTFSTILKIFLMTESDLECFNIHYGNVLTWTTFIGDLYVLWQSWAGISLKGFRTRVEFAVSLMLTDGYYYL